MPRPRKSRIIRGEPVSTLYKPSGVPKRDLRIEEIPLEGFEALRLTDVENLDHDAAAEMMQVSRPTFSRILSAARSSISKAIVNGWGISINGGDYIVFDDYCRRSGMGRGNCNQGRGVNGGAGRGAGLGRGAGCGFGPGQGLGRGQGRGLGRGLGIQKIGTASNFDTKESGNENSLKDKSLESDVKILAISSDGNSIESHVNARFGRANHFFIVDLENMSFEHIDNSAVNEMGSGAGIKTAEMITNKNVDIVITGDPVGPKASAVLNAANIQIRNDFAGMSVKEAAEKFSAEN